METLPAARGAGGKRWDGLVGIERDGKRNAGNGVTYRRGRGKLVYVEESERAQEEFFQGA
jgi:hypothetical protein